MKVILSISILTFALTVNSQTKTNYFDLADSFFVTYVQKGRVNYQAIYENQQLLETLVQDIATFDTSGIDVIRKKSFLINAYNILVIKGVITNYPIGSPKDVPGFFNTIRYTVAGQLLTLDELEFKKVMAGNTRDPRFHFVLNCAALSCPTLYKHALRPESYEDQLGYATLLVMDRDDYVKVDHPTKTVKVSQIFKWYESDFIAHSGSIRAFINQYRFTSVPSDYPIEFMEYDWSLNSTQ